MNGSKGYLLRSLIGFGGFVLVCHALGMGLKASGVPVWLRMGFSFAMGLACGRSLYYYMFPDDKGNDDDSIR
jgi:hypothetical protein